MLHCIAAEYLKCYGPHAGGGSVQACCLSLLPLIYRRRSEQARTIPLTNQRIPGLSKRDAVNTAIFEVYLRSGVNYINAQPLYYCPFAGERRIQFRFAEASLRPQDGHGQILGDRRRA
jgi:hypothetical protein